MESIRSGGAELVAISPQSRAKSRELIEQKKLGFDILRDEENRLAEEFGLKFQVPDDLKKIYLDFGIDLKASNGEASGTLPMPARYLIDTGGVIRDAHVHPDYTQRPEPEATLTALRSL